MKGGLRLGKPVQPVQRVIFGALALDMGKVPDVGRIGPADGVGGGVAGGEQLYNSCQSKCPSFSLLVFKYRSLCGLGFTRIGNCSIIFSP
jgi:hypothetical protein